MFQLMLSGDFPLLYNQVFRVSIVIPLEVNCLESEEFKVLITSSGEFGNCVLEVLLGW